MSDGIIDMDGMDEYHRKLAIEQFDYFSKPPKERPEATTAVHYLPTDAKERKRLPVMTGVLDYFPLAICAVAELSLKGNEQHNGGQPLHWARGKSMDHADTAVRHLMERGTLDTDGVRHTAKAAWRCLAELQEELEAALGKPVSRGSR